MVKFNFGKLCLVLACATGASTFAQEAARAPQHPQKKASEILREKVQDLRDYDLNWTDVQLTDSQTFLPEMTCDLSKKYFELSTRPGFKAPTPPERFGFPDNGSDYDTKGVMPWPGILGHWQDWNTGAYLEIERIQERDLDGKVTDYMLLRLHSMCTDELLAESALVVQNPALNQQLKIPTMSYGLRVNAGQLTLKINRFDNVPATDELEIEFHYVDSFTKEPKRSMIRVFRFL